MSWKKYFRVANVAGAVSPINGSQAQNMTYRNYQSNLPEVYIGHPNRIERYNQYEQMIAVLTDQNGLMETLNDKMSEMIDSNRSIFNALA